MWACYMSYPEFSNRSLCFVCAPGFGMCEPDLNRMSGWKRSAKCSKRGIFGVKSRSGCYFFQAWQPLPPLSCIHIPRARLSTLFLSKDITNHKVSKGFKRHVPKIPQRIALTGKCCQWTRICHCFALRTWNSAVAKRTKMFAYVKSAPWVSQFRMCLFKTQEVSWVLHGGRRW